MLKQTPPPSFGAWLRQRRLSLNWTQAQLAARVGCAPDVLRQFEAQVKRPSPRLAQRLAEVLQLPSDERERFVGAAQAVILPGHTSSSARPRQRARPVTTPDARPPELPDPRRFTPPPLPPDLLARPRLAEVVDYSLTTAAVLLVSAPAGAGKTVALAQSIERLVTSDGAALNVAWISLETEDTTLPAFGRLLVAALLPLVPAGLAKTEVLLATPADVQRTPEWARRIADQLSQELAQSEGKRTLLVLDDMHLLHEPASITLLDRLLLRLPAWLTMILVTRHDPPLALARLRTQGRLADIRLPVLCFTADEVAALLSRRYGQERAGQISDRIWRITEGWPAPVALLAAQVVGTLQHTLLDDAFVAGEWHLFGYLADELLGSEDGPTQRFLLDTSILDELTPAACDALTGRTDSAAVLQQLARRNWLRLGTASSYPALVRRMLHWRLDWEAPAHAHLLHQRAATLDVPIATRITHALRAEAWALAVSLIQSVGEQMVMQGLTADLHTWITALPTRIREAHPWLLYWQAIYVWERFDPVGARLLYQRALQGFVAQHDQQGEAEALSRLVLLHCLVPELETARALIARCEGLSLRPHQRARLWAAYAVGLALDHQSATALAALDTAVAIAEQTGDPTTICTIADHMVPLLVMLRGGIVRAERLVQLVAPTVRNWPRPAQRFVLKLQVHIALQRGRWSELDTHYAHLTAIVAEIDMWPWAIINVGAVGPLTTQIRGRAATLEPAYDILFAQPFQPPNRFSHALYAAFTILKARFFWIAGDNARLMQAVHQFEANQCDQPYPVVSLFHTAIRAMVLLTRRRYAEAATLLEPMVNLQAEVGYSHYFVDVVPLLATAYLHLGRQSEVIRLMVPHLAWYEAEQLYGLLLWQGSIMAPLLALLRAQNHGSAYVDWMLSEMANITTLEEAQPGRRSDLPGVHLSPRELDVLRLMATGANNKAIAAALVISVHTVKHHVTSILQKLAVTTRVEAIARLQALHHTLPQPHPMPWHDPGSD